MAEKKRPGKRQAHTSPFAKNLKEVMKGRGVSLRKAAELCGVEPSVLHGWLQGGQPQDMSKVLKLCEALECDFQWLLTGVHDKITIKRMGLSELFEIEDDPTFSGIFMIEAKRLKRRD